MFTTRVAQSKHPSKTSLGIAVLLTGWMPLAILIVAHYFDILSASVFWGGVCGMFVAFPLLARTEESHIVVSRDSTHYTLYHPEGNYTQSYAGSLIADMAGVPIIVACCILSGMFLGWLFSFVHAF